MPADILSDPADAGMWGFGTQDPAPDANVVNHNPFWALEEQGKCIAGCVVCCSSRADVMANSPSHQAPDQEEFAWSMSFN
jgi:hypothetical protein